MVGPPPGLGRRRQGAPPCLARREGAERGSVSSLILAFNFQNKRIEQNEGET